MTENIGIDNLTSITYYDENLPLMLTGASIWEMLGKVMNGLKLKALGKCFPWQFLMLTTKLLHHAILFSKINSSGCWLYNSTVAGKVSNSKAGISEGRDQMEMKVGFSSEAVTKSIRVHTRTRYVSEQSNPERHHYFFAYTIVISNEGPEAAQLRSRHWIIKDANGKLDEVRGAGVVGDFPHLEESESYEYTSFCVLATATGTMKGSYQFTRLNGEEFDVAIAEFRLAVPGIFN